MECGRHNLVSADLRSSEQEVVRRVGVYDITRHFRFQISNLALETNLSQRMTAPGVEAKYGRSHGRQLAQWETEKI